MKKSSKWIVDAIALVALLLVFIPDLTGLVLHEWIGIVIAGVLLVHFLQHWDWVMNTSQRLPKLKSKVLSRYLVDGILVLGFSVITITGLVISSLLMLPLANYEIWRLVHVFSSYLTALMLVVKLVMHWEMIAKMMKKVFDPNQESLTPSQQKRRYFLRGFGVTAVASLIAIAEIKEWINKTGGIGEGITQDLADTVNPVNTEVPVMEPTTPPTLELVEQSEIAAIEATIMPTAEPTEMPTVEPTIIPTEVSEQAITGVVKCRKGCSYPGKCGRYYDDNNNGKCDLGEPIW